MPRVLLAILIVLVIIHVVAFLGYGLLGTAIGLKVPDPESPGRFMLSVFVQKCGHALAFVLLFYIARDAVAGQWLLYGFVWWLFFAVDELGLSIGPMYSFKEAVVGVLSEAVYLPMSAWVTNWLLT